MQDEFRTGYQEQAYLEPQGMVAVYEEGILTIRGSMQLRRAHFLSKGDTTSTGGLLRSDVRLEELADTVCCLSGYAEKRRAPGETHGKRRGIGCSVFFHGCGFTGAGERDLIQARVRLQKHKDGTVQIFVSSAELGQGAMTTLSKIVAHTLDIPLFQVKNSYPDTAVCPDSGPTVASRTVMVVGKLLEEAARKLKRRWDEPECEAEAHFQYPAGYSWDKDTNAGDAYLEYAWGANVVEIELDPATYTFEIKGVWAAYDIGTPIDETIVGGQIEGGMAQGLGYGSMEELDIRDGKPLQCSLTDYILPSCPDFPPVSYRLLDVLREDFGLTGTKEGCGQGECGACAVLVDGQLVNACLLPVISAEGKQVVTIEGFRKSPRFGVLRECFEQAGAVQCGFCTPGMLLAAEALLSQNPMPSEEEIRRGLSGNLCRCTGYTAIVQAVAAAAKEGNGLWPKPTGP